jgi:hypothetical protein
MAGISANGRGCIARQEARVREGPIRTSH